MPVPGTAADPDIKSPEDCRPARRISKAPCAPNEFDPGFETEHRRGPRQSPDSEVGDMEQVAVGGYECAMPITQGKIGLPAVVQRDGEVSQVGGSAFALEKGSCFTGTVATRGGSLPHKSPGVTGHERHHADLTRTRRQLEEVRTGQCGRTFRSTRNDSHGGQAGREPTDSGGREHGNLLNRG